MYSILEKMCLMIENTPRTPYLKSSPRMQNGSLAYLFGGEIEIEQYTRIGEAEACRAEGRELDFDITCRARIETNKRTRISIPGANLTAQIAQYQDGTYEDMHGTAQAVWIYLENNYPSWIGSFQF